MIDKIIVFLKHPRPGHVKTRLAPAIGPEKAVEVYEWLIQRTLKAARNTSGVLCPYWDEPGVENLFIEKPFFQSGDNLGDRLANAIEEQRTAGSGKILIIGSDCPEITTELIDEAFLTLDESDVVVGPAFDGGFYLMGFNNFKRDYFFNVQWSTNQTLNDVLQNFKEHYLIVRHMKTLRDLDLPEDYFYFEEVFLREKNKWA